LLHLLRNAVDHGLETVEERRRVGKPVEGRLRLSAQHQGGTVVIELSDDGRGLDRAAIAARARASGLWREGGVGGEALSVIFEHGFTTSETVTEVSGRGVGLDVVRRAVETMRGQVTVSSEPGNGTCFRMSLPLTLAIIEGMLVSCGRECYVIPTLSVVESMRPRAGMLLSMANRYELLNLRGELIPLLRLGRVFEVDGAESDPANALVVVIENLGRKVGLMVDEVVAQQQVVIKSMGEGLGEARLLSGAAILPNGNVALIVNVDEICCEVGDLTPQPGAAPALARGPESGRQLVVGGVR
jgi:two-component system chemotaxis sensor kinase CheA